MRYTIPSSLKKRDSVGFRDILISMSTHVLGRLMQGSERVGVRFEIGIR